jgi:hypothetical protein
LLATPLTENSAGRSWAAAMLVIKDRTKAAIYFKV